MWEILLCKALPKSSVKVTLIRTIKHKQMVKLISSLPLSITFGFCRIMVPKKIKCFKMH